MRTVRWGTMVRRWSLLGCGVLLGLGVVWGVSAALASSASPAPDTGKVVLHVGIAQNPDNLNPFIGYSSASFEVWHLNYDLLVGYAPDGSPRPELATHWSTSPDGKIWTFKIRQGVTWQDGVPFTARDVAFTYNYIVDNAADLPALSAYTLLIRKAVAVDDTTVRFICSKPKANMLRLWIPILPQHIWSKIKPGDAGTKFANSPPIVGTGPFQCVEWNKGSYIKMVRNDHYWGPKPKVDEVLFEYYQSADTMADELKNGSLDVAWGIPYAQLSALGNTPGITALHYVTKTWDYLGFNVYAKASGGAPALKDVRLRQALSWAIDRNKLCALGWGGYATPGTTIMPPGVWAANLDYHYQPAAAETFGFDLSKAKALLDAAGYKDTNGDGYRDYKGKPITLRLWSRSSSPSSQVDGKLITSWWRSLGMKVTYTVLDEGSITDAEYAYQGKTFRPNYDTVIWDWVGYADPGDTLQSFTTSQIGMWNDPGWSNPAYDALVTRQASELDPHKRLALIHDAQRIFYDQAPYIVLDYPQDLEAFNSRDWTGWVHYPSGAASVIMSNDNIDSYLYVHPTGASAGGASKGLLVALIAAGVAIVVGAIVLVRRRRAPLAVEEV